MVIAIANQKVAKTTTAHALAARLGRTVLAVDLDPQASLTMRGGASSSYAPPHRRLKLL